MFVHNGQRPAIAVTALLALLFSSQTLAHMEMSQPYPINSNLNPEVPYWQKDYSYTSPLFYNGSNFPCKGYQNQRPVLRTASYRQGGTYQMSFSGTATHDGGSCQISLSYDNGKTFRVIKSMIGGCPLQPTYQFTIPHYAPLGSPLLAWTWMNQVGNREYYMNCAWVEIQPAIANKPIFGKGSDHGNKNGHQRHPKPHMLLPRGPKRERKLGHTAAKGLIRRDRYESFEQLPFIWKANIPPENNCITSEGEDVIFTNPGPDVVYGDGYSSSMAKSPNNGCDTPGPPGPTYKDIKTGPFGSFQNSGSDPPVASSLTTTYPFLSSATSQASPNSATNTVETTTTSLNLPQTTLSTILSPSLPSPTLPNLPSPTVPGQPYPTTGSLDPSDDDCNSSIPALGFKCLRSGYGFAVCDNYRWVDMGQTAYGTLCSGGPGQAVIVPYSWNT